MSIETFRTTPYEAAATSRLVTGLILTGTVLTTPIAYLHSAAECPSTLRYGCLDSTKVGSAPACHSAWESLRNYIYDSRRLDSITAYLFSYPDAQRFITGVSDILDSVFGNKNNNKILNIVSDPDTSLPLLELVFQSNIPIDEEFMEKDRKVYDQIVQNGLESGFEHVVLTVC